MKRRGQFIILMFGFALLLASYQNCARQDLKGVLGSFPQPATITPPSPPSGTNPNQFGLNQRVALGGINFPEDVLSGGNGPQATQFTNFVFNQPVYISGSVDGTDRIFVIEKPGVIKVFSRANPGSSPTVFLDLSSKVDDTEEQGLLGMAFEPTNTSLFYIYYNPTNAGGCPDGNRSLISRFQVSGTNINQADVNSEAPIISICQPTYHNHKGGNILFGPDKKLYIGLGDGGSGGDPDKRGQDKKQLLAKMLRISPNTTGTGYTIPTDNPFYNAANGKCSTLVAGNKSAFDCGEIWAYGVRNPWRWSFDRLTGALWVADVGQDMWEEIDIVSKGNNMGWNLFEANHPYASGSNSTAGITFPLKEYSHSIGTSITGGYVYHGTAAPSLQGKYIYGDYGSSKIWSIGYDSATNTVTPETLISSSVSGPVAFGEDENAELYVTSINTGKIFKFTETGATSSMNPNFPQKLSDTGLFTNAANLTPNPGLIAYNVNEPFWSDGATKKRWIGLPTNSKIGFSATGNWTFPSKTVFVKHFDLFVSPLVTKRVETRVFINQPQDGWRGYTYIWRDDQTDADLAGPNSQTKTVGSQQWFIPGRSNCMSCHTTKENYVLGVRTRQLNGLFSYGSINDNQLRAWNHIALFTSDIGDPSQYSAYVNSITSSASLDVRARTYLAVNCSICHQSGGTASIMDLRYDTPLASTGLLNGSRLIPGNSSAAL